MRLLLLALTTGYQTRAFRAAAEGLGAKVTLGTDRCHVLEDPWRDGAVALRFEEPEESAETLARQGAVEPFDGLIAVGDRPLPTAAAAARRLGLAFHSPAGVRAASNKYLSRQALQRAGLPTPAFGRVRGNEEPSEPPPGCGYPCILKPLGLSGSQGVIRANGPEEFREALRRITRLLERPEVALRSGDAEDWIQVESFLSGQEFALEGLVHQSELKTLALFDKPDPLDGPFFEETIYTTPSRADAGLQREIRRMAQRAVRALGLDHGPVHAEMRVNEQGVWMIEAAARPIGGLCARALRFTGGMTLEDVHVRHALGMPVASIKREDQAAGVMMIPVPESGIFETVDGVDEASEVAGVEEVVITAKAQQRLTPWPEGNSYPGFIFARGSSPDFVERALREAHGRLRFQISAALPVL